MAWISRTKSIKGVSVALASGLAAGVVALPAATASASIVSVNQSEKCDSRELSSVDRWQSGQLSLCANTVGQTLNFSAAMENLQYYWGGAWYNNKYPTRVVFEFSLARRIEPHESDTIPSYETLQRQVHAVKTSGTTTDRDVARGEFQLPTAGKYTVYVWAHVYGQYWGSPDNSKAFHLYDGKNLDGESVPMVYFDTNHRSKLKTSSDGAEVAYVEFDTSVRPG